MVTPEQGALIFLGYLLLPLVVLFLFWLVGLVLRRLFRKGVAEDEKGEV